MFLSRRKRRANRDAIAHKEGQPVAGGPLQVQGCDCDYCRSIRERMTPGLPLISPTARLEVIRRLVDDAIEAEKARVWAEVGIGGKGQP